jgi:hypothetical protein
MLDHLWEAAADVWNQVVIPPYLSRTTIDEDKLKQSRDAHGGSTTAADLFKEAFRRVRSIE